MGLYTGLIRCENNHAFKARRERNNINYRCNYRLKNGTSSCDNDTMVEELYITELIRQQLDVINMEISSIDIYSIVKCIIVSKTRIEVFFKNLPIVSCYYDSKLGKLHFDTLRD